jgi:drug/metabolite transporter (DMT)-like permease
LLPDLLSLGFVGITICALTYFTAIRDIDTSLAIVIFYCNPVMVVLASWLIYKKKPSKSIVYALIFTMVGVGITTGEMGSGSTQAVVLVLISSLAYVFYALGCSRSLKHTDMFTGVTFVNIGAALGFNLYALVSPNGMTPDYPDTTKGWLVIVALAVVGTVFPTSTFFMGLKRIGTNMTSIFTTSEPVFGIACGILILNEHLSLNRVIGAAFVIGALLMLSVVESRSETVTAHQ